MQNRLPLDLLDFAQSIGFTQVSLWPRRKLGVVKGIWHDIYTADQMGFGQAERIRKLVERLNKIDDAIHAKLAGTTSQPQGVTRIASIQKQIELASSLYPSLLRISLGQEKGETSRDGRIGYGLVSTYKPRKIDRESVVLDSYTTAMEKGNKSIIYTPGWSIKGAFDDDQ